MTGHKRKGRAKKYCAYVRLLEDDTLYTPSTIVDLGIQEGLFPKGLGKDVYFACRKKVRQAMSRIAVNLPQNEDGWIKLKGQQASRAWLGSKWKDAIKPDDS